jgi:uncharacterized repeat protein (TIGR03803 family)
LVSDGAGNFYGTTYSGGTFQKGTVYKITSTGSYSLLYTFGNGYDSDTSSRRFPSGALVSDGAGNFYGMTSRGGIQDEGTLFKITATGNYTEILPNLLPIYPSGALAIDSNGNLYGASTGGPNPHPLGVPISGKIFKITFDSSGYPTPPQILCDPISAQLVSDGMGGFYGATSGGGGNGKGAIFKLTNTPACQTIYSFNGGSDGAFPAGPLSSNGAGNLYGVTSTGGISNGGVIFKITNTGSYSHIYSFPPSSGSSISADLNSAPVIDGAGNLYGTTRTGGASNKGSIFKIDNVGNYSLLHSFSGGSDGANPYGQLTSDGSGNLYGVTTKGGTNDKGTIFRFPTN